MKVKLIKHNTPEQQRWGGNDCTKLHLHEGGIYEAEEDVRTWHTKIIINGNKFNSVCFEEVKEPVRHEITTIKEIIDLVTEYNVDALAKDFNHWLHIIAFAKESPLIPNNKFIWIDDGKHDIEIKIINEVLK